jgi:hypothetical protein
MEKLLTKFRDVKGQRQYLIAGKAELELDIIIYDDNETLASDEGLTILHALTVQGKQLFWKHYIWLCTVKASVANDEGRFCELH